MNRLRSALGSRVACGRIPAARKILVVSMALALVLAVLALTMAAAPPASAEASVCLAYLCEPEPEEEPKPNIARPRVSVAAKDLNGGTLDPGDEILWTITVKNLGGTLTKIVVTDVVPAGTSYVAGSIDGSGANDGGGPTLKWSVGSLGCGDRVTVSFVSRVDDGLSDGTLITNQASADSAQTPPGVSKAVTLEVGCLSEKTEKADDGEESDDSEKSEKDLSLSSTPTTLVASMETEAGEGDSAESSGGSGAAAGESSDSSETTSSSAASADGTEGATGDDSAAVAGSDDDNGWKLGVGLGVGLGGLALIGGGAGLVAWRRKHAA